jgi:hypothetical protein
MPVVVRSKAWVCGRSLPGIAGFESRRGDGCLPFVSVVCCQVEVSATGRSFVQRSPTECAVSERHCKASTMSSPWPTRAVKPHKKN